MSQDHPNAGDPLNPNQPRSIQPPQIQPPQIQPGLDDRPKIQHSSHGLGQPLTPVQSTPVEVMTTTATSAESNPKIHAFGEKKRHEDKWTRTPNTTGTGAIHVKSFHSKLTDDALTYMDHLINEWLDAHPQYEVKFVTTTTGTLTGKLKEPHIICQVWV